MSIVLNHTIVPARDKEAAARFFAHICPRSPNDMEINHRRGGRGVYFHDPEGHLLELLTRV
jgi:hypothetical protein